MFQLSQSKQREREETEWRTQKHFPNLEACSNLEQNNNSVQFVLKRKKCSKPIKHKVGPHKAAAGPSAGLHRLHRRWGASFRAPSVWAMNIFGPFTPRFLPVCVLGWMCFISFSLVLRINISFYLARNTEPLFCPWGWNKMFLSSQSFIFMHFFMHEFISAG